MEQTSVEALTRRRVEHQALREAATRLEAQVHGCDCGSLPRPIGRAIASLLNQLREHLADEDRALAALDPGPLELARQAVRRREQLRRLGEMLDRLAEPLHDGPLRAHVLRFVDWIEAEIDAEEGLSDD